MRLERFQFDTIVTWGLVVDDAGSATSRRWRAIRGINRATCRLLRHTRYDVVILDRTLVDTCYARHRTFQFPKERG